LAGILRWTCPDQGQLLREVFSALPAEKRSILTNELNVHGGIRLRAISLEGVASLLLNPQIALQRMPANGDV
jgi:hypothetical protein